MTARAMTSDMTNDLETAHTPASSTLLEERYTLILANKDTEMEDLKKRLAATEEELTQGKRKEEELKQTKVCAEDERGGRLIVHEPMRQRGFRV
jgi:hypothetical protein